MLISGPTALDIPEGVDFLPVETAADMHEAVSNYIGKMEIAIFAAAVADFDKYGPYLTTEWPGSGGDVRWTNHGLPWSG